MTYIIAEAAALAGCAITRLVARMIRKCEFRLGLHPHPAVKCQKDRKMSLGNTILNIYMKSAALHIPSLTNMFSY